MNIKKLKLKPSIHAKEPRNTAQKRYS